MTIVVHFKNGKREEYEDIDTIEMGEASIKFSTQRWVGLEHELEDFRVPKVSVEKVEIIP